MYDNEVVENILHIESSQSITTLIFKLEQNRERIEKLRKNCEKKRKNKFIMENEGDFLPSFLELYMTIF